MDDLTLSEVVAEQLNPATLDRIHVIHSVGGEWLSLFMKLETLKEWVNNGATGGTGLTITELPFLVADDQVYAGGLDELIQLVIFKPTDPASTYKVGTAADDDFYLEETTISPFVANIHLTDPIAANREVKVTVSGAAMVKIISILSV